MRKQHDNRESSQNMRKNLIIDIVVLLVYLVVANPVITGIAIHEWLGLGIFIAIFTHCLVHVEWVLDVIKSRNKKPTLSRQGNLMLDVLMVIAFVVVTVSGLGVSGTVLQTFGLYIDGYYFWGPLHSISAKVLLALFAVHLVVHWRWIIALFRKEREGNADGGYEEDENKS